MLVEQFAQRFHRRFLHHTLESGGCLAVCHEHPVVFGYLGAEPQAITHHIHLGYGLQGLGGAYEHIAADNHRMQGCGCRLHDAFIERRLYVEQVLRESLSPLPSEYGYGSEHLARGGIRRQPSALSARVQQYSLFRSQPLGERLRGSHASVRLHQQMGAAASTA